MAVLAIGISHKTAPVETRERLAFSADELPGALALLGERFGSGVILSTCNRTEVYLSNAASGATTGDLTRWVLEAKGYPTEGPPPFTVTTGMHAVRHLYRVACGIDSMVVGEAQILGQARQAMAAAKAEGTLDETLSRLFSSAVTIGRRARAQTGIGRHSVSISSAGVKLAKLKLGDLSSLSVLVISAGEAGKLAARHVMEFGPSRLVIANRSPERAKELAARLGGASIPFERLDEALVEADIVLSSSSAPGYLVQRGPVEAALARRGERPLLFIDMAVPRDVDPAVAGLPGVHLCDIDDLQSVADGNLEARTAEIDKVERMVEEETARFASWWRAREVVPTIAALRQRAEAIRQAEIDRTVPRLRDLSDEERRRIDAMTGAMIKRLLHEPIYRLRHGGRGVRYVQALQELFDLPGAAEDEPTAPPS